jgi:hypothetical protein
MGMLRDLTTTLSSLLFWLGQVGVVLLFLCVIWTAARPALRLSRDVKFLRTNVKYAGRRDVGWRQIEPAEVRFVWFRRREHVSVCKTAVSNQSLGSSQYLVDRSWIERHLSDDLAETLVYADNLRMRGVYLMNPQIRGLNIPRIRVVLLTTQRNINYDSWASSVIAEFNGRSDSPVPSYAHGNFRDNDQWPIGLKSISSNPRLLFNGAPLPNRSDPQAARKEQQNDGSDYLEPDGRTLRFRGWIIVIVGILIAGLGGVLGTALFAYSRYWAWGAVWLICGRVEFLVLLAGAMVMASLTLKAGQESQSGGPFLALSFGLAPRHELALLSCEMRTRFKLIVLTRVAVEMKDFLSVLVLRHGNLNSIGES